MIYHKGYDILEMEMSCLKGYDVLEVMLSCQKGDDDM